MKYNFDYPCSRKKTHANKWHSYDVNKELKNTIPMWIADMDFEVEPKITDALVKRAKHPIYGYTLPYEETNKLIKEWYKKRNKVNVDENSIFLSTGVNYSYYQIIQYFVAKDEKIILNSPIYPPFYHVPESLKRKIVYCPMIETNKGYEFDFEKFEELLKKDKKIKLFNLCNPYNPIGKLFTLKELNRIAEICDKYDVYIAADEIHADIIIPGNKFVSALKIDKKYQNKLFVYGSVTKTFNLAGLKVSYMIVPNKELKEETEAVFKASGLCDISIFGLEGINAAFKYGEKWLDQCLEYIKGNLEYINEFIKKEIPKAKINMPQGTYMAWLDLRAFDLPLDFNDSLKKDGHVEFNPGQNFLADHRFLRVNVACPRSQVEKGMANLKKWLKTNKYI